MILENMHENIELIISAIGQKRGYFPVKEKDFDFWGKKKIDVVWIKKKIGIKYAFEIEMSSSKRYSEHNRAKLEELAKRGVKVLQIMIHPERFEVLHNHFKPKELRSFIDKLNPKLKFDSNYCETTLE